MAEKNQQVYPLAPANGQARSDEESATLQSKELKKKQRIKCAAYIAAFAVFQTIIIVVFALFVMRIKTPKVRLGKVTVHNLATSTTGTPSLNMSFTAQVTIKNTNFGHYKFDESQATFQYGDSTVGQAIIPKARARARSTKKIDILVNVNSNAVSSSDIGSRLLQLSSHAKLSGKVQLMKVIKKKKSATMSCAMTINLSTKAVQDLKCE